MDGRKGFKYDTLGHVFFENGEKNLRFENIRLRVDRAQARIVVSNSVTKSVFQDRVLCLEFS